MKYAEMNWGTMEAVVNKLGGMEGVRRFLRGNVEVVHIIDCDADPYVPDGYKVDEHIKGGRQFCWSPDKVDLHFCDEQKNGHISGYKLRKKLKGKPVLNANVLDYLLANPQLIPQEWEGDFIFFWGTIYRDSNGLLYVRYLIWDDGRWDWLSRPLVGLFNANYPAASRK